MKVVRVTWHDAYSCCTEPHDHSFIPRDYTINSVGFLLKKSKKGVLIAMELHPEGAYHHILFVPRGVVQKVKVLWEEKRGKEVD